MSGSSDNLLWMQNPELAQALRRRQMGEMLLKEGTDSSPIKSPWQGVNRLAPAGRWNRPRSVPTHRPAAAASHRPQTLVA